MYAKQPEDTFIFPSVAGGVAMLESSIKPDWIPCITCEIYASPFVTIFNLLGPGKSFTNGYNPFRSKGAFFLFLLLPKEKRKAAPLNP